MRAALLLSLSWLVAACAMNGAEAPGAHLTFGAAAGPQYVSLDRVRMHTTSEQFVHVDSHRGETAMLVAGSDSAGELMEVRLQYGRSEHVVRDYAAAATVEQYRASILAGISWGNDTLAVQPLVGVGVGVMSLDFEGNPYLSDMQRGMIDFDLGVQLRATRYLTFGAMACAGSFGAPGRTDGNYSAVSAFGCLRF